MSVLLNPVRTGSLESKKGLKLGAKGAIVEVPILPTCIAGSSFLSQVYTFFLPLRLRFSKFPLLVSLLGA